MNTQTTNQIDPRIEETFTDPIWQDPDNLFWINEVASEVSKLLGGALHLLDLGDFCFADHIGEPPAEVAYDICQSDDLAKAYLQEKEAMNTSVHLPPKKRSSTKKRLATMKKDLGMVDPIPEYDGPGPRVDYTPLKSVGLSVGMKLKADKHSPGLCFDITGKYITDGHSCLVVSSIRPASLQTEMYNKARKDHTPALDYIWQPNVDQATHAATPSQIFQGSLCEIVVLTFATPDGFKEIFCNRKRFEFVRLTVKAKQFVACSPVTPLVFLDKEGAPVGLLMPLDPRKV